MGLPVVSFKEFLKNPIVALLFMALMAVGYLYIDNRSTLTKQITTLQKQVEILQADYKELDNEFKQTLRGLNK
jgi:hypothetical protein